MRLGDLEYIEKILTGWLSNLPSGEETPAIEYCLNLVCNTPTIDAVPVVRCKDCRYGNCYDEILPRYKCLLSSNSMRVREDDFCSYGERKEDSHDD